jgi:hypothetical protein
MHLPLPPDTPCHVLSSQSLHGDYAITQVGTDVPLTLSTQCSDNNWDGQESKFSSYPKDDAVVENMFEAMENQKGLQAIVALKSSRSSFLDYSEYIQSLTPQFARSRRAGQLAKMGCMFSCNWPQGAMVSRNTTMCLQGTQ